MNTMLSYYESRFGVAKKQGDGFNGPCPLCGGDNGKSDRFMIWTDKTKDIGKTCAEHGVSGVYFCRQCNASGDTISYLEKCEGFSFKEVLDILGISINKDFRKKKRKAPELAPPKPLFTPQERSVPSSIWQTYASKTLTKAQEEIWNQKMPLAWLHERGLFDEAIKRYELGFLVGENRKQGIYRARSVLDLQAKKRKDGTLSHKIFIPRGIIIPTFQVNDLISLRFRRPSADLAPYANGYQPPKYMELEGSTSSPYILLPADGANSLTSWVIVESEFDAMLIHFSMGESIGVMAMRSNSNKPCPLGHSLLEKSPRILLAMDYEESCAGVAALPFWEEVYPQSRRWPVPKGKDPGDAFKLGIDISLWIQAGLPTYAKKIAQKKIDTIASKQEYIESCDMSVSCPQHIDNTIGESGRLDAFLSGENVWGEGEKLLVAMNTALDEWEFANDVKFFYVGRGRFKRKFDNEIVPCFDENHLAKLEQFMFEERHLKEWWEEHKSQWISIQAFIGEMVEIKKTQVQKS